MATAFFIGAIGLLVFVLAVLGLQDWEFLKQPRQRVLGTVFDHRKERNDGTVFHWAMIRFTTPSGRTIEFVDIVGRPKAHPAVGAKVDVVYVVATPDNARIYRPWLRLAMYVGFSSVLILLIAIGMRILP